MAKRSATSHPADPPPTCNDSGICTYIRRSMAMGYVPSGIASTSERFKIEILGKRYAARVQTASHYDPVGTRMRS